MTTQHSLPSCPVGTRTPTRRPVRPSSGSEIRLRRNGRKRLGLFTAMVLPSFLLLLVFVLLPLARGIQLSLYSWDGIAPVMHRVWLENYLRLWSDPRFLQAIGRTLVWWAMHLLLAVGGGMLFAAFLNDIRWRRFRGTVRNLAFLPHVLSLAVVGVVWAQLYHPTVGLVNQVLTAVGLDSLVRSWLGSPELALPAVGIASAWQAYGFYMVIFLAGMQRTDPSLYEAATLDGANGWQRFRTVTLPALHNTISVVIVLAFINSLKGFGTVWSMTEGGPDRASELAVVYVWRQAFQTGDIGMASAGGLSIGIIALVITVGFNRWRDRSREA